MKQIITLIILQILNSYICLFAQNVNYSTANAHSHNDYESLHPFITAYDEQYGSIEADIFLWNDSLLVGHTVYDLKLKRTLESLYLEPLQKHIKENNLYPYKDSSVSLQLLIDIKTAAVPTINQLLKVVNRLHVLQAIDLRIQHLKIIRPIFYLMEI